ncbi:MAG TPA: 6-bladed beta-propeller [Gemmatimonadales bacterium]
MPRLLSFPIAVATGLLPLLAGCGPRDINAAARWNGTIDTLESGTVAVTNPETGAWREGDAWTVAEELRIGIVDGEGPDLFGSITALEVDPAGRIYVLEGQAQELRVFDATGAHVRTMGREGGGPGEFARALKLDWGADGNLWIADPQNNRFSLFDTAGTFVGSHQAPGGFIIIPWPGRIDDQGYLYGPVPLQGETAFRMGLVRYDQDLEPMDTVTPPDFPGRAEYFEVRNEQGHMRAGVPFSPGLTWHIERSGTIWAMLTGEYKLFELTLAGDTLRTITRAFTPVPVTEADVDSAMVNFEWFIRQGGKVDRSRFPSEKPATREFSLDDEGNIWVLPITENLADERRLFEVFDPVGRYLGRVRLPFDLARRPVPVFRDGMIYGATEDDLEVPFVIRARITKP